MQSPYSGKRKKPCLTILHIRVVIYSLLTAFFFNFTLLTNAESGSEYHQTCNDRGSLRIQNKELFHLRRNDSVFPVFFSILLKAACNRKKVKDRCVKNRHLWHTQFNFDITRMTSIYDNLLRTMRKTIFKKY